MCSPDNKHFAQVILRSDDGETWTEHVSDYVNSGEIYQVEERCMILSHTDRNSSAGEFKSLLLPANVAYQQYGHSCRLFLKFDSDFGKTGLAI